MSFYQCYLLGRNGEIRLCEQVESASEPQAVALCREMLAARPHYAGFELWKVTRLIHSETRMLRTG